MFDDLFGNSLDTIGNLTGGGDFFPSNSGDFFNGDFSNVFDGLNNFMGPSPFGITNDPLANTGFNGLLPSSAGGGLSSLFGSAGQGAMFGQLLPIIGGAVSAANEGSAADKMMGFLNGQQDKLNGLFDPGSNLYQSMWDQMSRMDAAHGRTSQYGPRTVDLAARLAPLQAQTTVGMTNAMAKPYADALGLDAHKWTGLLTALGQAFQPFAGPSTVMQQSGGGGGGGSGLGALVDLGLSLFG